MRILIFDTPILRLQANTEILFFAWTDHFLRPEFTLNLNMILFHQQNIPTSGLDLNKTASSP